MQPIFLFLSRPNCITSGFFFFFKQPKWIRNTCTPYGGRRVWGRMLCVSRRVTWCLLGAASGVFDLFIRASIWDSADHTQREERLLPKGSVAGKLRIIITNKFSTNFERNSCGIHHCLSVIERQCEYSSIKPQYNFKYTTHQYEISLILSRRNGRSDTTAWGVLRNTSLF